MKRKYKKNLLMISLFLLAMFFSISASKNVSVLPKIPDVFQYENSFLCTNERFLKVYMPRPIPGIIRFRKIVEGKIKFPKNYRKTIAVYKLVEILEFEKEMLNIVEKFNVQNDVLEYVKETNIWKIYADGGSLIFENNKNAIEFDYRAGAFNTRNLAHKVLKKEELIQIGLKYLRKKGLLPKKYKILTRKAIIFSEPYGIAIRIYEIKNDLPITGFGNYIYLEIYPNGGISNLQCKLRKWEKFDDYSIDTPKSALKYYKRKGIFSGHYSKNDLDNYNKDYSEKEKLWKEKVIYDTGIINEVELVYYSGKNDYPYLIPMYLIKGQFDKSETEFEYRLPAIREEYIEYDKTRDKYGHPIGKRPVPVKVDDIKEENKK